jgi:hypothetical protein
VQARLDPEDRVRLWRAACWEATAERAFAAGARSHERACQVWAIGALLFAWSVGRPSRRVEAVTLSTTWQRRYVERLRDLERQCEPVA